MQVVEEEKQNGDSACTYDSINAVFQKAGSRYSYFVLFAGCALMINPGLLSFAQVFTSAQMSFHCSEYDLTGINSSISSSSDCQISYDRCSAAYNCSNTDGILEAACTSYTFNDTVFEQTVISKFQLVCNQWTPLFMAVSSFFIGFMTGGSVYGGLADKFGRLKLLVVGGINICVGTAAASQMPHLWLYCCAQVTSGFGASGVFSVLYTYTIEMSSSDMRSIWGFNVQHGLTLGIVLGTLIAYFVRSYDWLLLWYTAFAVPLLLTPLFLCESPRWLYSVGRFEDADAALRRVARFSGKKLGDNFSTRSLFSKDRAAAADSAATRKDPSGSSSFLNLVGKPGIRRLTLSIWFLFFTSSFGYYGIPFSLAGIGGDIYLNQLFSATVEFPARIIGSFLSYRLSRRRYMMVAFSVAGASLLLAAVLIQLPQLLWLRITSAMIGKFSFTISMDLMYLYSSEAYPTVIRNFGVGCGSSFAKLAALVSALVSQLSALWAPLPFVIFGLAPLTGSLFAFTLPETRGRPLPETLEEIENYMNLPRKAEVLSAEVPDADGENEAGSLM